MDIPTSIKRNAGRLQLLIAEVYSVYRTYCETDPTGAEFEEIIDQALEDFIDNVDFYWHGGLSELDQIASDLKEIYNRQDQLSSNHTHSQKQNKQ